MTPEPVALNTLHWGDGPKRALLLHGIGSNAAGWWRVGPDLAAHGWSVTAADLRGHGESPKATPYAISDHAVDALALGLAWDVVIGHSMGGAIAVKAQATEPAWARRVVLQDPAILVPGPIDALLDWLLSEYDGPLTPERVAADNPRWHPEDCTAKSAALQAAGRDLIEQTVRDIWPWDVLADAAAVTVPTAIIGSDPEVEFAFPVALGEWLVGENHLVSYQMFEGFPHSAHRYTDLYDRYFTAVLNAVGELPTLAPANEENT